MKTTFGITALALLAALSIGTASAQTMASPSPGPAATDMPAATAAPSMAPTEAPTAAPTKAPAAKRSFKKLKTATLSFSEVSYGLTHPATELNSLRSMKKVSFDNIRIVKLSSSTKLNLLQRLHIRVDSGEQMLAAADPFQLQDAMMIAQTNGSNSPIANLQNVLANINVSNALNNILNNSNVGVNVSLADVLNGNKIGISQVLGVYVHGFSIINTIIK